MVDGKPASKRRRFRAVLLWISVAGCFVTGGLWALSVWYGAFFSIETTQAFPGQAFVWQRIMFGVDGGTLTFRQVTNKEAAVTEPEYLAFLEADAAKGTRVRSHMIPQERGPTLLDEWKTAGFRLWRFDYPEDRGGLSNVYRGVKVPLAIPLVAFAVYPLIALRRHRRNQCRKRQGRCLACGYDLRGSGERCPECGAKDSS